MFIRSQNKQVLIGFERIEVCSEKEKFLLIDKELILGEFSTEEKCILVIDEIQDFLLKNCGGVFNIPSEKEI